MLPRNAQAALSAAAGLCLCLPATGADVPFVHPPHSLAAYSDRYTRNSVLPPRRPGRVYHVAPDGSDRGDGSRERPFATLAAARDAIRRLKASGGLPAGGVEVRIAPGRYRPAEPLRLGPNDAGTPDAPIVYRGAGADRTILTGGAALDTRRLRPVEAPAELARLHGRARGKVLRMDLADSDAARYLPGEGKYGLVSMDGHPLQLARWPNRGYNHIARVLETGPTTRWLKPGEKPAPYSRENPTGGKFTCREPLSPAVEAEFERSGDMRVQGYLHNDWYFQDEPVGRIRGGVIQLLHHTRYGIVDKIPTMPRRVRLVNVLAELDEPGEWYFDRRTRRLYVWPIPGFRPGASALAVAGGPPLLRLENTACLTFRDMTFENTGDDAATVTGGHHNLLGGCVFRNGTGRGVLISGGKYNGITGCDFYGLRQAMHIRGGDFRTLEPCWNFATNNIVHDCRLRGYWLIGLQGVGIRFAHNLLYNLNGAVSFVAVNLLMEYNEFYHIGYEMGDFNVAYCGAQWYTMNNIVRWNFVHHLMEPGGYPVMGFRNDDGGAGLKIYGNVFYRSGRGAGQFHGPANDFQNNIVLDVPVMWWTHKRPITPEAIRSEWDRLARFGRDLPRGDKGDYLYILERTIGTKGWLKSPWKDTFPVLGEFLRTNPWAQTFCNVVRNYAWNVREPFHIHRGSGTIQGLADGRKGRFADLPESCRHELPEPITPDAFVDVASLDFRFRPSFRPMENFRPIPFERIGLLADRFRPNPPDKAAYRRAVYQRFRNDRTRRYDPKVVNARYPRPAYLR